MILEYFYLKLNILIMSILILQQAAQQLTESIISAIRMDPSSVTPVTSNSLDNSLRIVVHPTPSVDLATIVESTSNGKHNSSYI